MPSRRAPKKHASAALWQISRITGKGALVLGQVEAADADAAIKAGIEKYDVEPERQHRVMARPVA